MTLTGCTVTPNGVTVLSVSGTVSLSTSMHMQIGRSFLVVFGPSKSHTSGNISFKFGFFFKAFDALPRRHDHDHDQQRACQHGFDNLLQ